MCAAVLHLTSTGLSISIKCLFSISLLLGQQLAVQAVSAYRHLSANLDSPWFSHSSLALTLTLVYRLLLCWRQLEALFVPYAENSTCEQA
jgi:hypothetical protein